MWILAGLLTALTLFVRRMRDRGAAGAQIATAIVTAGAADRPLTGSGYTTAFIVLALVTMAALTATYGLPAARRPTCADDPRVTGTS